MVVEIHELCYAMLRLGYTFGMSLDVIGYCVKVRGAFDWE
jgi:hypothetical protein